MGEQVTLSSTTDAIAETQQVENSESVNGKHRSGRDRRIDKLTAQNKELQERLARYEGNGATQVQDGRYVESLNDAAQAETANEKQTEEPSFFQPQSELPEDFQQVMERAQSEGLRISDAAAETLHALPNADVVAYEIAKSDELRSWINSHSESQQAEIVKKLGQDIADVGLRSLAAKMREQSSPEQIRDLQTSIRANSLGTRILASMSREVAALPNAAAVAAHVLKNPELCQELAQSSQSQVAMVLGSISAGLQGSGRTPVVSKAPPPIRPLGGRGVSTVVPDGDAVDYQTYKRLRDSGKIGMSAQARRARGMV